jgi:hypothetical protein
LRLLRWGWNVLLLTTGLRRPSPHDPAKGALSNTPPGRCQRRGLESSGVISANRRGIARRPHELIFPLDDVSKPRRVRFARLRRDVMSTARSHTRVSVETHSITRASIAPVPVSWELPRSRDRNRFETSVRRKCCSIVSRKRMSLRRLRNWIGVAASCATCSPRARRKNNSALIFGVFAPVSVWRLMVFEAL